ncbi:GH39 family glycosyl hydrolase [Siansivirga zeaxanthinifaciens]|uniref:Glycosyl hydrolases family 39 N-terminal catalytic domain-containing protein n=1 Tax=Siansivirga zeaxanthinifaciens CC-SAMT-1 TaxID=1454006 RepID=A0A0C5WD28_9FLAO|nr:hypothetical protein [Siansivirga zeaxanthinifaciens]AJR04978.1 hypothetical protein AW14_13555 [Siansivirga zeaxanthinifaciens CC-SAMT-1]
MKIIVLSFLWFIISISIQAQVKFSTDFTSESKRKFPIHDVWNAANRISPRNGSTIRPGLKMNIVRMIEGIIKVVNGVPYMDLDFDPCLYDSINNVYVYRWEPLIERLDKLINSKTEIFQIALDQPPWAFQHGYKFIPTGTRDNINFRENERMSKYGNSLPPADKRAYHDFIKALMVKLVETYGKEKVLSWRFRVGSEIETPEHWYGTKQDFIEHFANTESAVRSVLPNAIVGLHTREHGFLKTGKMLNYKGEPFASFIEDLIDYNFANNVKCDFWGLSDYIKIGDSSSRNMRDKYAKSFAPLISNPKWNANTTIDLMEYSTVTTMNGADGRGVLITCETTHRDIVELVLSNMFYKYNSKGLKYIYRWANGIGSEDPEGIKEIKSMLGMVRYETSITGNPNTATNELDAIFAKDETQNEYDVLIYNYNSQSINYIESEAVNVSFFTAFPVGTTLYYRSKSYGKENNKLQNFLVNNSNFVKSGFDNKGAANRILTPEGYKAYKNYENPNPHLFTKWKSVTTTARSDGKSGSEVNVDTKIGSFAFEKFEFRYGVFED